MNRRNFFSTLGMAPVAFIASIAAVEAESKQASTHMIALDLESIVAQGNLDEISQGLLAELKQPQTASIRILPNTGTQHRHGVEL